MKARCPICKNLRTVTIRGTLHVHTDGDGHLCRGSGGMPEIPKGQGKRIVHSDPGTSGKV